MHHHLHRHHHCHHHHPHHEQHHGGRKDTPRCTARLRCHRRSCCPYRCPCTAPTAPSGTSSATAIESPSTQHDPWKTSHPGICLSPTKTTPRAGQSHPSPPHQQSLFTPPKKVSYILFLSQKLKYLGIDRPHQPRNHPLDPPRRQIQIPRPLRIRPRNSRTKMLKCLPTTH